MFDVGEVGESFPRARKINLQIERKFVNDKYFWAKLFSDEMEINLRRRRVCEVGHDEFETFSSCLRLQS